MSRTPPGLVGPHPRSMGPHPRPMDEAPYDHPRPPQPHSTPPPPPGRGSPRIDAPPTPLDPKKKKILLTVAFTLFLDLAGFGIILPNLPLYAEDPSASATLVALHSTAFCFPCL